MTDRWQLAFHFGITLTGIVAVSVLAIQHDISGTMATYVILALTGITGSQAIAAQTVPSSVARLMAGQRSSSSGMGQGG